MEIKNLQSFYRQQVADIAAECFIEDGYFKKYGQSKETRRSKLIEIYSAGFDIAIRNGNVYGVFENNSLIGFAVVFDYKKLISNKQDFDIIFPYDCTTCDYNVNLFIEKVNNLKNVSYLNTICVLPQYQRKGIGSNLVKFLTYEFDEIVSDVENVGSLSIYKNLGFIIEKLNESYYFVYKSKSTKE